MITGHLEDNMIASRKSWLTLQKGNDSLPYEVAMCLPAYNEGDNLRRLLPKLLRERDLTEIVVIASGCTDDTVEVARSFEPHVRTIVEPERSGKSSAINLFLRETTAPVIIMESTDTLPGRGAIKYMLEHFRDPNIGAVGSRPIPTNPINTVRGLIPHILWRAHHSISLKQPKIGEMVAWRRGDFNLGDTAVDEAFIEAIIANNGLKIVYEPKAVTYNHGPENFKELVRQRKRIYRGHLSLKDAGYTVSTFNPWKGLLATLKVTPKTRKGLSAWAILMYAEGYSRLTTNKKDPEAVVWDISPSTKNI